MTIYLAVLVRVIRILKDRVNDNLYRFSPWYIRRRICFLELYYFENFGKDPFGGYQFFRLRVIPQANLKCEYILNQYYNTREIWKVRGFFVLVANKYE